MNDKTHFFEFIHDKFGLKGIIFVIIFALVLAIGIIWIAAPGKPISFFNGLVEFTKKDTSNSEPITKNEPVLNENNSKKAVKAIGEQNKKIDEYNVELSKNVVSKTYLLFNYVIGYIDSRLSALQGLNPGVD